MSKHSIICAGIDTGKRELEVALEGGAEQLQVDNAAAGHAALSAWLRSIGSSGSASRRPADTNKPWSPSAPRWLLW